MNAGDIAQLLTAVALIGNMLLSWRTHIAATKTHKAILETDKNVANIEKATNGMKDALIAATAKASQASGDAQGRKDLLAEQKTDRDARDLK